MQTWLVLKSKDSAYIGDPAFIETFEFNPRLVLETRLVFETWLLLEVLRYVIETLSSVSFGHACTSFLSESVN